MAAVEMVALDQAASQRLTAIVLEALLETAFSNRMMIAPRRLREISAAEIAAFQQFLTYPDIESARLHGRTLAETGFGHNSILRLTSALRSVCKLDEAAVPADWQRLAEDYSFALLMGYMQGREDEIVRSRSAPAPPTSGRCNEPAGPFRPDRSLPWRVRSASPWQRFTRVKQHPALSTWDGRMWEPSAPSQEQTPSSDTASIIDALALHRDELIEHIHASLKDLLFTHRSYLRLSQIRTIAATELGAVIAFLVSEDREAVTAFATQRANMGLDIQAILRIMGTLTQFCTTALAPELAAQLNRLVSEYMQTYLVAYMAARDTTILAEQERIRAAIQRSLTHNNRWLQTAAAVSHAATSTLNLRILLNNSVDLIRSHYDFFHVGLFLLDSSKEYATLSAISSRVLDETLPLNYRFHVDPETMVGRCLVTGEAQVAVEPSIHDTRDAGVILPSARSVMTLPLVARGVVIGAILIQSDQLAAFGEDDITRLRTVADQMSNAIQNARLYHELEVHNQRLAEAVKIRTTELEQTKERVEAILTNSPDAILLLSPDGAIDLCNRAFFEMFQYDSTEILQKPLHDLVDPDFSDRLSELVQLASQQGHSKWFQFVARRKDDSTFDAGAAIAAIRNNGETTALVCSLRDVSEQVAAEAQIRSSLREKEVLLREIHHRVKNNMQVISSLLALQAGYTNDDQATQMFRESQNRIRSMALVHELLYQSQDLAQIDFVRYVRELTRHLIHSYLSDASRVELQIVATELLLDIDMAIPCGLIINELVSNSLKHAFPNHRRGKIQIFLDRDDDGLYTVMVRDDGVGLPEGLNVHRTESLGLQLVTSLASQINATIGLQRHYGTTFEIRFAITKIRG
ncbi:MAG: PAS domain S-box protein [Chloroflexi bacterium]|nr:PAS domain S-box protein [Chloroflexota bacterium]